MSNVIANSWYIPLPVGHNPLPELNLPLPLRTLIARRGFESSQEAYEFLNPKELPNPYLHFRDLEKATTKLLEFCKNKSKIAICGDYDADGITSTALLIYTLKHLGADPIPIIPNRITDGYGLNSQMIEKLNDIEIKLIVTVDNGITSHEAISLAKSYSIDVILTDHHRITSNAPEAYALIHPSTLPDDSPYKDLAGVGLAYIVSNSVAELSNKTELVTNTHDLFCIGTIADMTTLRGANRYLLKKGLVNLHRTNNVGLKAIYQLAGIGTKPITSEDIGFKIAPRINSVGRIGDPSDMIKLLTTNDSKKALDLARDCEQTNKLRRELTESIEEEALALVDSDGENIQDFIFIAQNHWHPGIIGIVATRLMQRYHRPVALLAPSKSSTFRASVRTPIGFSAISALTNCSSYLENYGGHECAGGFTVRPEHIPSLTSKLNNIASIWVKQYGQYKPIKPEAIISINEINYDLWNSLQLLEPHGNGNLKPLFWTRNLTVSSSKVFSSGHLKLLLKQADKSINAIFWGHSSNISLGTRIDVAYFIENNFWNGTNTLQLNIVAFRTTDNVINYTKGSNTYKCSLREDNSITLTNRKGTKIRFMCGENGTFLSDDSLSDHKYVNDLFREVAILFGLHP